ncbi:MAG: hypothetical protein IKZ08_02435 [Bacteroidales bacterium]|nr:hypothetical protein [Bacteroidales bacterium]
MKKILAIVLVLVLLCSIIVGCSRLISTEYKMVQVEIVDEYHRAAYYTQTHVGKDVILHLHPEEYGITVKYNGTEYTSYGKEVWERYKDRIGDVIDATAEIRRYDDGIVWIDIILLGEGVYT